MINRTVIPFVLLVLSITRLNAQKIEIGIHLNPSSWYNGWFEPGLDGGGLAVGYHPELGEKSRLNFFVEYSLLRSRNEVLSGIGIRRTVWQGGKITFSVGGNILNGLELVRPVPLYVIGGEMVARLSRQTGRRLSFFLDIGARYTVSPGYREIGVWRHNMWPVGIGIGF